MAWLRDHPIIALFMVSSALLGLVLGVVCLPDDWTLLRRLLGGVTGGLGAGLVIVAPRMVGT